MAKTALTATAKRSIFTQDDASRPAATSPESVPSENEAVNQHVDRLSLVTKLAIKPVEAAPVVDPIIAAINDLRQGLSAYGETTYAKTDKGSHDKAMAKTYGPALKRLSNWDAPATTIDGAIAALRMARDELAQFSTSDVAVSMVSAALSFYEKTQTVPPQAAPATSVNSDPLAELINEYRTAHDAYNLAGQAPSEAESPALTDAITTYRAAKVAGLAADDDKADALGKVWIEAFCRVAECPCHSLQDVQAKAALMVEIINDQDMAIDDGEALAIFRSMEIASTTTPKHRQVVDSLLGTDDPLVTLISEYRRQCAIPVDGSAYATDEDREAATYGPSQNALCDAPPRPTTIAGVAEAIRLAIEEDAFIDQIGEQPLRAALAFLDETNRISHPDSALLIFGEALKTAWSKWDAIAAKAEMAGHPPEMDDEYEAAYNECHLIVRRIETTKARTIEGLKVKARAVEWCHCGDTDIVFGEATDCRLAADIIKTLLNI